MNRTVWMSLVALGLLMGLSACEPRPQAAPGATASAPVPAASAPAPDLAVVREHLGKYPHEGVNYLEQGALGARLKALVGPRYPQLLESLRTVGPLSQHEGLLYVTGSRPFEGGSDAAAVVIDPERNVLRVWMLAGGAVSELQSPGPAIELPPEVQAFVAQHRTPGG